MLYEPEFSLCNTSPKYLKGYGSSHSSSGQSPEEFESSEFLPIIDPTLMYCGNTRRSFSSGTTQGPTANLKGSTNNLQVPYSLPNSYFVRDFEDDESSPDPRRSPRERSRSIAVPQMMSSPSHSPQHAQNVQQVHQVHLNIHKQRIRSKSRSPTSPRNGHGYNNNGNLASSQYSLATLSPTAPRSPRYSPQHGGGDGGSSSRRGSISQNTSPNRRRSSNCSAISSASNQLSLHQGVQAAFPQNNVNNCINNNNFRHRTLSMPTNVHPQKQKIRTAKRGSEDSALLSINFVNNRGRSMSINEDAKYQYNGMPYLALYRTPGPESSSSLLDVKYTWKSKSNESTNDSSIGDASGSPSGDCGRKKMYNVALIGGENTGKNSIASYFDNFQDQSDEDEDEFEESEFRKSYLYAPPDYDFIVRLFNDSSAREHLYKYDGFIIVYSVTDRESFKHVEKLLNSTDEIRNKLVLLCGNKSDNERSRIISQEDGKNLATTYGCKFIEISALLGHGVDALQSGLSAQLNLRNQPLKFQEKRGSFKKAQKILDKIISKWSPNKSKSCLDLHNL